MPLDRTSKRGGRWRDHWPVIDAIAFKYRTGTPWVDLPGRCLPQPAGWVGSTRTRRLPGRPGCSGWRAPWSLRGTRRRCGSPTR
ncbi:hypothetical protein [Streptomyces sp. NPDC059979]|uniref:hypothetical protein n=1 Tax=Streptomyces sp. NPDC059979 TaxID=3347021 RepID=UPI0036C1348A